MSKDIRTILMDLWATDPHKAPYPPAITQALSEIRELLEGEAVNFELDMDGEVITQQAIPLEALNRLLGGGEK